MTVFQKQIRIFHSSIHPHLDVSFFLVPKGTEDGRRAEERPMRKNTHS